MLTHWKSIRTPLLVAAGAAAALCLVAVSASVIGHHQLLASVRDGLARDQAAVAGLDQMYAQGLHSGRAIASIVLDPASKTAAASLEGANRGFGEAQRKTLALAAPASPTRELLQGIEADWQRDIALKARIQALAPTDRSAALALLAGEEAPLWRKIEDRLLTLQATARAAAEDRRRAMAETARNAALTGTIAGLLAIVIGIGGTLLVTGRHRRFLAELSRSMAQRASGNADPSGASTARSRDGAGRAAGDASRIVAPLQEGIAAAKQEADDLARSSARLSCTLDRVAHSSRRQSDFVSAVSATIEELIISIASVAESAALLRRLSTAGLQGWHESRAAMAKLLEEIRTIDAAGREIERSMEEYAERARQINGLTGDVRDIASQARLLALNAAVEAARAGSPGRSLAAVADEVRSVAEGSSQAAVQIESFTKSIAAQSEMLLAAVRVNHALLDQSARILLAVTRALDSSVEAASLTGDGAGEIRNASRGQQVAGQDIAQPAADSTPPAHENGATLLVTTEAARQLQQIAEKLRRNVQKFKLA